MYKKIALVFLIFTAFFVFASVLLPAGIARAQDGAPAATAVAITETPAAPGDVDVIDLDTAPAGDELVEKLQALLTDLYPRLFLLLALMVADVLFGSGEALVAHKFDFKKLGEFYSTKLFPLIIGWLTFSLLWRFTSDGIVGALAGSTWGVVSGQAVVDAAWAAIMTALGASIRANILAIAGKQTPAA